MLWNQAVIDSFHVVDFVRVIMDEEVEDRNLVATRMYHMIFYMWCVLFCRYVMYGCLPRNVKSTYFLLGPSFEK